MVFKYMKSVTLLKYMKIRRILVPNILTVGTKVMNFIYFKDYLLCLYFLGTKLERVILYGLSLMVY